MDQLIKFPSALHSRILERAFWERFRIPAVVISFFLLLNIGISGFRATNQITEHESFLVFTELFQGFEPTWDFLVSFKQTALETLPIFSIAIFFLNIFLILYFSKIVLDSRKNKKNNT